MARKPPSWRQRLLFPPDASGTPEPPDNVTEGSQPAVQDDRSRTTATTTGDTGPTPQESDAAPDNGILRQGVEDRPRSLEGTPLPGEAAQRPESDRERGSGDSPQGTGGSFALRVSSE